MHWLLEAVMLGEKHTPGRGTSKGGHERGVLGSGLVSVAGWPMVRLESWAGAPNRPRRRVWIYSKWEEKSLEGLEWGHTVL